MFAVISAALAIPLLTPPAQAAPAGPPAAAGLDDPHLLPLAAPAQVPAAAGGSAAGNAALNWAEAHALGHWYCWAGAGPSCYDCSGLVMAAFGHADGISLPHSTYLLPGDRHLHRIPLADARRGDILLYGPGHTEIDTAERHTSFGAQRSGTRVGWHQWSRWWHPTAAYRVY